MADLTPAGAALATEIEHYLTLRPAASTPAARTAPAASAVGDGWGEWLATARLDMREKASQLQHVPADAIVHLLGATIAVLDRDGWARGAYTSERGHCLKGAVETATRETGAAWEVGRAAELSLEIALHRLAGTSSLIVWNDNLGRRAADVLELISHGIAVARRFGGEA